MMMIDNIYPITHDGSMYGIYIYANKAGVFVDGKWQTMIIPYIHGSYLVGGWATPLKNMKVNWDDNRNPILMGT